MYATRKHRQNYVRQAAIASMDLHSNERDGELLLHCDRFQIKGASMAHGPDGPTFSCGCGPLSAADLAGLDEAVERGTAVRLVFPGSEVRLSHVRYEHQGEQGWVRIYGRVISAGPPNAPPLAAP